MFDAPSKVALLMRGFEPDWCVAGGWAIDLFLGVETRPHADIEIAVSRRDQIALQKHFAGWHLKKAENGALADWRAGEFLELPTHEIHCFKEAGEPRFLEVLLNEANDREWIFRRHKSITKPLAESYFTMGSGVKFLRPEMVLLYKSKNPRAKDEQDFQTTVKRLDAESGQWLKNALSICYAERHHWLESL